MDFFSRQPQAFQGATQGRQAEVDTEFLACSGLQFYQGQVGLRLYPCQDVLVGGGVKPTLLATAMGFGGEDAGGAVALQELFDERNTDAKEFGDSALGCLVSLARLDDLLAQIS